MGQQEFRARSGRVVKVQENGAIVFDHVNGYITPDMVMDAEEFFQAKTDDEIGRWRSPLFPEYVVYDARPIRGGATDGIRVWNEREGVSRRYTDISGVDGKGGTHDEVARAYFEAHPEQERLWAGAQFITWRDGAYLPQTAQRDTGHMNLGWRFGRDEGEEWFSEDRLAREIGDAEVTILVGGAS